MFVGGFLVDLNEKLNDPSLCICARHLFVCVCVCDGFTACDGGRACVVMIMRQHGKVFVCVCGAMKRFEQPMGECARFYTESTVCWWKNKGMCGRGHLFRLCIWGIF